MSYPYARPGENQFIMIGVIHGDREGKALLEARLESARPDAVTVEVSPYGLAYRLSEGEALKGKVRSAVEELRREGRPIHEAGLEALFAYIDPPFEFTSASDYCARHGASVFPIDLDRFSSGRLRRMEELVSKENLAMLLSLPARSGGASQKAIARLFFEKGIKAFSYTEEMRGRDRHMSGTIAGIMKDRAPACLVHICGWQHLCDPFDEYGPLRPKKVFIHDKAFCV
jgi:hypothetical protein